MQKRMLQIFLDWFKENHAKVVFPEAQVRRFKVGSPSKQCCDTSRKISCHQTIDPCVASFCAAKRLNETLFCFVCVFCFFVFKECLDDGSTMKYMYFIMHQLNQSNSSGLSKLHWSWGCEQISSKLWVERLRWHKETCTGLSPAFGTFGCTKKARPKGIFRCSRFEEVE